MAKLDIAADSDSEGRGFESLRAGQQKSLFCLPTKGTFLSDAFLTEREAHCVRDTGFACDARLRHVSGTYRITYHSAAASLIMYVLK